MLVGGLFGGDSMIEMDEELVELEREELSKGLMLAKELGF